MTHSIRFNKPTIEALPAAPEGKRDYYEDPKHRALRLRVSVTDRGSKSWVVQRRIQGRVSRITLGQFPDLTPENAIKEAEKLSGQLAAGETPKESRRNRDAHQLTLSDALESMLEVRGLKAGTQLTYRNIIKGALADWSNKPLTWITPDQIADRHAKLSRESGGPYANSVMRTLRSIWNFTAAQYEDERGNSLLPPNPVARLSKTKAWVRIARRRTFIAAHQLAAWFEAVNELRRQPWGSSAQTVGDFLVLLLLTGLRRTEAATLKWENVDLKAKTIRLPDTKNHDEHVLPLSDYLFDLLAARKEHSFGPNAAHPTLNSEFVFPADNPDGYISEPRAHVDAVKRASGVDFMLHDLRRTFSTVAEGLDLSYYSLKRLINHRMTGDVTAGYISRNVERLRPPMQQITDTFLRLGGLRVTQKIVPFPGGQAGALAQ